MLKKCGEATLLLLVDKLVCFWSSFFSYSRASKPKPRAVPCLAANQGGSDGDYRRMPAKLGSLVGGSNSSSSTAWLCVGLAGRACAGLLLHYSREMEYMVSNLRLELAS